MSLDPKKKRELVFLFCFSIDSGKHSDDHELVEMIMNECKVTKKYATEALQRAHAVVAAQPECDNYLSKACPEYAVDRMASVERTILRLAVFEGMIERELSSGIIVSEAKRLAKKFSTDESVPFVHAVLGALLSEERP